jgi:hypothetical protein
MFNKFSGGEILFSGGYSYFRPNRRIRRVTRWLLAAVGAKAGQEWRRVNPDQIYGIEMFTGREQ